MKSLTKVETVVYHLYPGVLIAAFFSLVTPYLVKTGLPPQLSMMIAIVVVVIPIILIHLNTVRKREGLPNLFSISSYNHSLSQGQIIGYSTLIIVFAFLMYGLTRPLNTLLEEKLWYWLPSWYRVRDFSGYSKEIILVTLIANLILNGVIGPVLEELYFRGYLLPRLGDSVTAPVINCILFSVYHVWQPQIYLTLIFAMFPLSYLTWKTKSLKLAIYSHCGLNLIGALLSFGALA